MKCQDDRQGHWRIQISSVDLPNRIFNNHYSNVFFMTNESVFRNATASADNDRVDTLGFPGNELSGDDGDKLRW